MSLSSLCRLSCTRRPARMPRHLPRSRLSRRGHAPRPVATAQLRTIGHARPDRSAGPWSDGAIAEPGRLQALRQAALTPTRGPVECGGWSMAALIG